MKKIILSLFILFFCGLQSLFFMTYAQDVKTDFRKQNTLYLPGVPKKSAGNEAEVLTDPSTNGGVNSLLVSVKNAINRVLGLLALIALIILIFQGVSMLINAKDSKKIEEGYTTVKNVAIALVFIGVSWLVVSFIFRAIGIFTTTT